MNVVVAGGTGFIGQKIVSSLLENDHKVFVLTRNLKKHKNAKIFFIKDKTQAFYKKIFNRFKKKISQEIERITFMLTFLKVIKFHSTLIQ